KWRERTGGKDVDDTWQLAFTKSPTLVDEFTVFDWAMDPNEAWNAYARWLPDAAAQMKPLPVFQTQFDYVAHSWDRKEKLVAKVGCLPVKEVKPTSADIEIRTAAGEVLLTAEKQSLDEGSTATFTIDKPLPFGTYPAIVRSRDAAGKVLAEEKVEYVREKPEWLGNTLGEERTIPKGWTPIKANGQSLDLVGRRIDLGANGLPEKIETRGRQILARPIAMRAAGPGGDAKLAGAGMKLGATADDRVEWKAVLAGAGVKADVDAWLEFDGLLYCTVTLKPESGAEATLDELDIDVPMVPAEATQLLANGGGNDFRASWIATMVPAGEGSVWRSSDKPYPSFGRADGVTNFMPHIWVGADDVGLYFGAENDKGWTVDGPNPAQEILREKDAVVFRMNVIREATKIPAAGRAFHFILLPTPAKPAPDDWRKQMAAGGVNFGSCDTFGGFDLKTDPTDPVNGDCFRLEPRSWAHAETMAPQCRAKWGRCILYTDAAFPGPGPAFRDWNHDLWAGTGNLAWTPECEDYAVWAINEFLKRGVIDGVYWDDVSVGNTYSLDSTAYEYAGSKNGRRVGFTSLALRRVNLRLWRLFEAAGREPCIWAHMTVCYEVPLFSFCRYLSNGEFVTGVEPYGKRDAMDFWKPETLRLLGGSEKWGTGVSFLSTLPRGLPPGPAAEQWAYPQVRTEDALYATSGIQSLSNALTQKLVETKIYDQPLRCVPWWEADTVVKLEKPEKANVLSAVYAGKDRVIVFVSNFDRDGEREVTVELDPAAVFPGRKVTAIQWRDLDPGLDPPKVAVADAAEIAKETQAAANAGLEGKERPLDAEELDDFLQGTTPEGRAKGRLGLTVEGSKARVTIRPRDYRVLEAKPGG
ncbi:MAG: glycoside hydrolase domain-containing protein, partial [Planctomycetia bacterium]